MKKEKEEGRIDKLIEGMKRGKKQKNKKEKNFSMRSLRKPTTWLHSLSSVCQIKSRWKQSIT